MRGQKADQIIIDDPMPKGGTLSEPYKTVREALTNLPEASCITLESATIPPEVRLELYKGLASAAAQLMAEGWSIPLDSTVSGKPAMYSYRIVEEEDAYLVFVEVMRHGRKSYFSRGVNLPATTEMNDLILALSPGRAVIPTTTHSVAGDLLRELATYSRCHKLVDYTVVGPGVTGKALAIIDSAAEKADITFGDAERVMMKQQLRRRLAYLRLLEIDSSMGLKKIAQALALFDLRHYGYDNPKTLASGALGKLAGDVIYLARQIEEASATEEVSTRFFPEVKPVITALLLERHYLASVVNHGSVIGAPVKNWIYCGLRNNGAPDTLPRDFEEAFAGLGWFHTKMIEAAEEDNAE